MSTIDYREGYAHEMKIEIGNIENGEIERRGETEGGGENEASLNEELKKINDQISSNQTLFDIDLSSVHLDDPESIDKLAAQLSQKYYSESYESSSEQYKNVYKQVLEWCIKYYGSKFKKDDNTIMYNGLILLQKKTNLLKFDVETSTFKDIANSDNLGSCAVDLDSLMSMYDIWEKISPQENSEYTDMIKEINNEDNINTLMDLGTNGQQIVKDMFKRQVKARIIQFPSTIHFNDFFKAMAIPINATNQVQTMTQLLNKITRDLKEGGRDKIKTTLYDALLNMEGRGDRDDPPLRTKTSLIVDTYFNHCGYNPNGLFINMTTDMIIRYNQLYNTDADNLAKAYATFCQINEVCKTVPKEELKKLKSRSIRAYYQFLDNIDPSQLLSKMNPHNIATAKVQDLWKQTRLCSSWMQPNFTENNPFTGDVIDNEDMLQEAFAEMIAKSNVAYGETCCCLSSINKIPSSIRSIAYQNKLQSYDNTFLGVVKVIGGTIGIPYAGPLILFQVMRNRGSRWVKWFDLINVKGENYAYISTIYFVLSTSLYFLSAINLSLFVTLACEGWVYLDKYIPDSLMFTKDKIKDLYEQSLGDTVCQYKNVPKQYKDYCFLSSTSTSPSSVDVTKYTNRCLEYPSSDPSFPTFFFFFDPLAPPCSLSLDPANFTGRHFSYESCPSNYDCIKRICCADSENQSACIIISLLVKEEDDPFYKNLGDKFIIYRNYVVDIDKLLSPNFDPSVDLHDIPFEFFVNGMSFNYKDFTTGQRPPDGWYALPILIPKCPYFFCRPNVDLKDDMIKAFMEIYPGENISSAFLNFQINMQDFYHETSEPGSDYITSLDLLLEGQAAVFNYPFQCNVISTTGIYKTKMVGTSFKDCSYWSLVPRDYFNNNIFTKMEKILQARLNYTLESFCGANIIQNYNKNLGKKNCNTTTPCQVMSLQDAVPPSAWCGW